MGNTQVPRAYKAPSASVNGWIKLHRQTLLNEFLCGDIRRLGAWAWLLLNANYEPRKIENKGREIVLQPGQLTASYAHLASTWGWKPAAVRWFLQRLVRASAITCDGKKHSNQTQVITLVNWDKFQSGTTTEQQQTPQAPQHYLKNKEERKQNNAHAHTREGSDFWQRELNPQGGLPREEIPAEMPSHSDSERSQKVSAVHSAQFRDGVLDVSDGLRQHWLPSFGGDNVRLQYAITQAAGYVQPNSNRPLVAQINAQLARIAGNKRDGDARYSAAKGPKPISAFVRDTSESFEQYRARMIAEGKLQP